MTQLVDQGEHHRNLGVEIGRLLDWTALSVDQGRVWWLTDEGRPDASFGGQLWITTRMAHVLSLGHLMGRPGAGELADQAIASIDRDFVDATNGGWFARISAAGEINPTKAAYEHSFVLLAASSAAIAARPGGVDLLDRAKTVVLEHFWDDGAGMMVESWNGDWTDCEAYRGANANMHAVEAFLATADATGAISWRERAARIAQRIVTMAEQHSWRLPEHYDQNWLPRPDFNADEPRHPFRPYGATPGHAFEWARLLLQLGSTYSPVANWTTEAAENLFGRAVADGWDEQLAGFAYTTDWSGHPVVRERFHWVHSEALAAAVALWRATGNERYAEWYQRIWGYTWERFPAKSGGWRHELDPAGTLSTRTWAGRPDTYHAIQACLMPMLPIDKGFALGVNDPRALPWVRERTLADKPGT